jgi:hypothetical protein
MSIATFLSTHPHPVCPFISSITLRRITYEIKDMGYVSKVTIFCPSIKTYDIARYKIRSYLVMYSYSLKLLILRYNLSG